MFVLILLLSLLWNEESCIHAGEIDRWENVRLLPPASVKIIQLSETELNYELRDENLVVLNRTLHITKKTKITDKFREVIEKEIKGEKFKPPKMKFILYCGKHYTLYQADILPEK